MSQVLYDVPGPRARRRSRVLSVVTGVIVVAVLAFAAVKLAQAGQFSAERWLVLNDPLVWGLLLQGLWVVLQSAAVAAVLAILLGMVLALLRMSEHRVVRYAVTVVLEFFRGMPVLLMMLFIYLIFPIGPYWSSRRSRCTTARSSARRCAPGSSACRAVSGRPASRSACVRCRTGSSWSSRRRSARCCRSSSPSSWSSSRTPRSARS
jgi:His/Glu/Gln/Arg/opine family amino acid ABC transporter permease subunit